MLHLAPILGDIGQPLFGSVWLALLAVLGGIAVFLALIAVGGRWLAATHPDTPVMPAVVKPEAEAEVVSLAPEIVAVIAASVTAALGAKARIASVKLVHAPAPSVEALMQQWSLEGRREIYGSHKVR